FADHMTRTFGVEWEPREMGRDRNPSWAITDVPEELVAEFSTRARQIEVEKDRLVAEYVATHGRQPSDATVIRLRAQATLATCPDKQVRSEERRVGKECRGWWMGGSYSASDRQDE